MDAYNIALYHRYIEARIVIIMTHGYCNDILKLIIPTQPNHLNILIIDWKFSFAFKENVKLFGKFTSLRKPMRCIVLSFSTQKFSCFLNIKILAFCKFWLHTWAVCIHAIVFNLMLSCTVDLITRWMPDRPFQ